MDVLCTDDSLVVDLAGGRTISVPLVVDGDAGIVLQGWAPSLVLPGYDPGTSMPTESQEESIPSMQRTMRNVGAVAVGVTGAAAKPAR